MTNKLKMLNSLGILGDVRERLGADNAEDETVDAQIEKMPAKQIVSAWTGWHLGDGEWGKRIYEIIETLEKEKESDLVSFGNFLLSKERQESVSEENQNAVTDADLANWKETQKQ